MARDDSHHGNLAAWQGRTNAAPCSRETRTKTDRAGCRALHGPGDSGHSALDSANALLDKFGTLSGLMNRPLDEIARVRGIKATRAIRLAAAYELCQRLLRELPRA